jgi:polysaccharide export outer membrane protein
VNVWKNTDLSQTVTVDPDGFVSLPLLGNVNVAGLSTDQLGTLLAAKYASYVVTPQVTVSVVDIRSRTVFVMGQVGKAGSYPLLTQTTVLQLIAQAGGLTPFAKRKNIYVLRASMGQSEKIPFNFVKVIHGDSRANIVLQPGDTVIVP